MGCGSRWNPINRQWSKSSDCCLNQLEWPLLHQRQIYFTICQVHNIIHHLSAIPFTQYFSADNRHSNPSALFRHFYIHHQSLSVFLFLSTLLFCGTRYLPIFYRSKTPNHSVLPSGTFFLTQCFVFIYFCTTFLFLYLCVALLSCTCPFWEHVCRPSLLCNPCLFTKIDNNK